MIDLAHLQSVRLELLSAFCSFGGRSDRTYDEAEGRTVLSDRRSDLSVF